MPWDLNGNNLGANLTEWLGTRDAQPLVIGTQNGGTGLPTAATEAMRITAAAQGRRVGIGTPAPQRRLHVEPTEIHSGGSGAGFSFGNRLEQETGQPAPFTENPANGERWVWYASGTQASLWSGTDMISVARVSGDVIIRQGDLTILSGSVDAQEAVVGDRANFSNDVRGGHGEFNSTRVGVTGVTGTSSTTIGVRGESTSGSSELGIGVRGTNLNGFAGVDGVSSSAFGVRGISESNFGVVGRSTSSNGVSGSTASGDGVSGVSTDGVGVRGRSTSFYGGHFQGGKAPLVLVPASTAGRPTTGQHTRGELFMDSGGELFVCTAAGTPGTWRRFTTTPA
jgi:hypothetical protein